MMGLIKLVKNQFLLFLHFPDLRNSHLLIEYVSRLFITRYESDLSLLSSFM